MSCQLLSLSVIIPALNEEKNIKACMESAKRLNPLEIIVVDGGSTDRTREIAQHAGAVVIGAPRGRGIQMNTGASFAKGEVLLFLHADSQLNVSDDTPLFAPLVRGELKGGKHIGGFFRLKFDDDSLPTRLVELFANFRARLLCLPYGDQAIFIKRAIFQQMGGFKEYPFLEDIDLAIRLRKFGRLKYVPVNVTASARRIKKGYPLSPILVSMRNVVIAVLFMLGISPHRLLKLYTEAEE